MNALASEIADKLLTSIIPFPFFPQEHLWKDFEKIVLGGFMAVRINLIMEVEEATELCKIFPGSVFSHFSYLIGWDWR